MNIKIILVLSFFSLNVFAMQNGKIANRASCEEVRNAVALYLYQHNQNKYNQQYYYNLLKNLAVVPEETGFSIIKDKRKYIYTKLSEGATSVVEKKLDAK